MSKYSHFPMDIALKNKPLIEAWLEIRWKLIEIDEQTKAKHDPLFAFKLGSFTELVKSDFPVLKELDVSRIPPEMTPHQPRYQFRKTKNGYPLIQFGPGVATINFTDLYTWDSFKEGCLYLGKLLLKVYKDNPFEEDLFILRYRNAIPFNYSENDILEYLKESLNTKLELPNFIPGFASETKRPTNIDINFTFDLSKPKGAGSIKIVSGKNTINNTELIIMQIEVASGGNDSPLLKIEGSLEEWLELGA